MEHGLGMPNTNDDIRNLLEVYSKKFEKIIYHPLTNYYYREADDWRSSMMCFRHPRGKDYIKGYDFGNFFAFTLSI